MPLRLDDRWVWDFWHVADGADHHLFYLQAPRSLGDPDARHRNASIGHAVSDDLSSWTVLPDALARGPAGAWDDCTTWTGSIIRHAGRWCLLYTGTGLAEDGLVQRVGLATSDDLVRWERAGDRPVLEADPRWYELLDLSAWHDQAWRDPWVWHDAAAGLFHVYVTARAKEGDPPSRGVIGHATSADLVSWEVLPPVAEEIGFGELEVPQLVRLGGHAYLLVSGRPAEAGSDGRHGTYSLRADRPLGPFPRSSLEPVDAHLPGAPYAGKIVETADGPVHLAWEAVAADGSFGGSISDPRPVRVDEGGRLRVEEAPRPAGAGPIRPS